MICGKRVSQKRSTCCGRFSSSATSLIVRNASGLLSKFPLPSEPERHASGRTLNENAFHPPVKHHAKSVTTPRRRRCGEIQITKIDYDVSRPDFNGLHVEIQVCSQEEWGKGLAIRQKGRVAWTLREGLCPGLLALLLGFAGRMGLQNALLQHVRGLEGHDATWGNRNFLTRLRVAADTLVLFPDLECREGRKLDDFAAGDRVAYFVDDRFDQFGGFGAGQPDFTKHRFCKICACHCLPGHFSPQTVSELFSRSRRDYFPCGDRSRDCSRFI
ncbi:hypothetical protein AGR7C_Cc160219 [Agrobacterium deltaense Zutra 3/1]|uniref:Uncharacterized protein n=1 Tax=Agrobacterium deltaense Zutra 3/1 TaxID=1183427 RepID=A0A1S7PN58_9HYPH|nr:hypothetical protein AGR7C_Cc160219 [Agrobacterium deltaense Zutra 3/1]